MIEEILERIAVALETIAAKGQPDAVTATGGLPPVTPPAAKVTAKPAKKKAVKKKAENVSDAPPAEESPADEPEGATLNDIRIALKSYLEKNPGTEAAAKARKILTGFGAENLTQLKQEDYASALNQIEGLLSG